MLNIENELKSISVPVSIPKNFRGNSKIKLNIRAKSPTNAPVELKTKGVFNFSMGLFFAR